MSTSEDTKIANILKRWLNTANELEADTSRYFPITRLTSVKSLCRNRKSAQQFALHIAQRVQQSMTQAPAPDYFEPAEWDAHQQIVAEAIALMQRAMADEPDTQELLRTLIKQIDSFQGDDYRNFQWGMTVHFVRSGNLLKLEYAIQCFVQSDYPYYAYQLAKQYAEHYESSCGTGLIPKSRPQLLDIAEFWCQYYFSQSLQERFPKLVSS
ncbi:hypothetical protein NG796_25940 [Laspinema sp. A4]|uniref:hypothetical protein n=1 Tax=Laspinema sp. D2d TaxID=2953686 RepID=UPI0021BAE940|nr:hypothetical protein [Laspinema sp. D2d]MCT7986720.1 hypothetical protein [Laspinema sp. D2d]